MAGTPTIIAALIGMILALGYVAYRVVRHLCNNEVRQLDHLEHQRYTRERLRLLGK